MADSMSRKNRSFFVPAIRHSPFALASCHRPYAICSGLTPYAICSSFSGHGGRLAELNFPKKTPTPLFSLTITNEGKADATGRATEAEFFCSSKVFWFEPCDLG